MANTFPNTLHRSRWSASRLSPLRGLGLRLQAAARLAHRGRPVDGEGPLAEGNLGCLLRALTTRRGGGEGGSSSSHLTTHPLFLSILEVAISTSLELLLRLSGNVSRIPLACGSSGDFLFGPCYDSIQFNASFGPFQKRKEQQASARNYSAPDLLKSALQLSH